MTRQEMIRDITKIGRRLRNYRDTHFERRYRDCMVWPDGRTMGFGGPYASNHDQGGFKKLGFTNYWDFFRMPAIKRERYLKEGLKIYNSMFRDIKKMTLPQLEAAEPELLKKLKELARAVKRQKAGKGLTELEMKKAKKLIGSASDKDLKKMKKMVEKLITDKPL